jgi:tetratricopeptide (TPR) repeat protein
MTRIFAQALVRSVLLTLLLALPQSQVLAAVDPHPFQNHGPVVSEKTLGLLTDAQKLMQAGKTEEALRQLNLAASLEPRNPYVLARLGVALNIAGQYDNALDKLRRARKAGGSDDIVLAPLLDAMLSLGQNQIVLDLYPDPPADNHSYTSGIILRARASALQVLGDSAGASVAMQRSLAILNDYDGVMTAARIALLQGDLGGADAHADRALKRDRRDIDAQILKIDIVMRKHLWPQAQAMAEELVAQNPRSVMARLVRIKVYLSTERADKAGPDIDRIMAEMPGIPILRYFKAVYLANRGDAKGAWAIAHSLPKEYLQVDPGVALNVANMAVAAGFPDSGAAILNVVVLRFPWLLEPRLALTDLRLRQKSAQYALNTLTMVQDSKDPRVLVLFARAALLKHDIKTAQTYILRVVEAGGGEELRSLEDKSLALKTLGDYSAAHPADKLAGKHYALLLMNFGEMGRAKTAYEALVRDDPQDAVAFNNLSWLVVKDDPARALTLAQQAVKADPASANNLDTLGSMQMNRSDFKGAVASLQKAHDMEPDAPELTYHLALALQAKGDVVKSQTLLQDLVKRGGFGDLDAAKNLLTSQLKMVAQTGAGQ